MWLGKNLELSTTVSFLFSHPNQEKQIGLGRFYFFKIYLLKYASPTFTSLQKANSLLEVV